jgi:hypothetical protein
MTLRCRTSWVYVCVLGQSYFHLSATLVYFSDLFLNIPLDLYASNPFLYCLYHQLRLITFIIHPTPTEANVHCASEISRLNIGVFASVFPQL